MTGPSIKKIRYSMPNTAEASSSEINGEQSHFSPGLEVLEGVSADATLEAIKEACDDSLPHSLAFRLRPKRGGDTCFTPPILVDPASGHRYRGSLKPCESRGFGPRQTAQ
jgi:hypothetical protein